MSMLKNLKQTVLSVADTLSNHPPIETTIYIHIGGSSQVELEECLDCIYFDDKRCFKLVDIKRQNQLVSALVVMEREKTPIKF